MEAIVQSERLAAANLLMDDHTDLVLEMADRQASEGVIDPIQVPTEMTRPGILSAEHLHMMSMLRRQHGLQIGRTIIENSVVHLLEPRQ